MSKIRYGSVKQIVPRRDSLVLIRLRSPKNRPYLISLILVLMVSWLSMLISNTCMMPASTFATPADAMPAGCAEMDVSGAMYVGGDTAMPHQDCSFKPCLDSHPNPVFEVKIDKPQTPIFVLCLIGLIGYLFHCLLSLPPIRRTKAPPIGRRVLLIYRFCTLLN
jgi:hypothetical protein